MNVMSVRQIGQPRAEFSFVHFHVSHFQRPRLLHAFLTDGRSILLIFKQEANATSTAHPFRKSGISN